MTRRLPVPSSPGPLKEYAAHFGGLFRALRGGFRRYLEGLLLPAGRNKTLTAFANAEPVAGAQRKEAQSLQWFLSESGWDPREVNERRLELLLEDPTTAPHEGGVLVSLIQPHLSKTRRMAALSARVWPPRRGFSGHCVKTCSAAQRTIRSPMTRPRCAERTRKSVVGLGSARYSRRISPTLSPSPSRAQKVRVSSPVYSPRPTAARTSVGSRRPMRRKGQVG
jgi:hypothetical protein